MGKKRDLYLDKLNQGREINIISSEEALKDVETIPWEIDHIDWGENEEELQELLAESQRKVYLAAMDAEIKYKRNSSDQITISIGDKFVNKDNWDLKDICPFCFGTGKLKAMQRVATHAGSFRGADILVKCNICNGTGFTK